MSIHRSLVTQGKLTRHRNVLTRAERLQVLMEDGRWKPGASPLSLPKVRSQKHKVKKAAKKKEEATATVAVAKPGDKAPAAKADKAAAKAPAKK